MQTSDNLLKEKLFSKASYSIFGQVFYMIGQLAILSSLSHFRGIEAAGVFGLAISIVTPTFVFANMGLRTAQGADQANEINFANFFCFRLFSSSTALLICILASFIFADSQDVALIIILYASAKFAETFSEVSYGAYEKNGRFDFVFQSLLLRSILTLIMFVSILAVGFPLWAAFFAQLFVWTLVAVFYDLPRARSFEPDSNGNLFSPDFRVLKSIFKKAAPMGGTNFLIGSHLSILRIYIESTMGLAALGVFTNISYIFQAGSMVGNSIKHILVPQYSKGIRNGDEAGIQRLYDASRLLILAGSIAGIIFVIFFGELFLKILFGRETGEYVDLLLVICLALSFRTLGAVPQSLVIAKAKTMSQFFREFLYASFTLALSFVFIKSVGLNAAGWILVVVVGLRVLFDSLSVRLNR